MTSKTLFPILLLLCSCTLPEEKRMQAMEQKLDTISMQTSGEYHANMDTSLSPPIPAPKKVKRPSGIFRTFLSSDGKTEQTIAFYNDLTYQLEEKYTREKTDSFVVIHGNWSPSDGYIWLYKDQVARGRYGWKGDTLQYFNPASKKFISMKRLNDVMENPAWEEKKKQGVILYGMGTEPFWSIEYNNADSISFQLPEWPKPLNMKLSASKQTPDSISYTAHHDSTQLQVTVYPRFCNDGMSGLTYRNKLRVVYNKQVFVGCGVLYR